MVEKREKVICLNNFVFIWNAPYLAFVNLISIPRFFSLLRFFNWSVDAKTINMKEKDY